MNYDEASEVIRELPRAMATNPEFSALEIEGGIVLGFTGCAVGTYNGKETILVRFSEAISPKQLEKIAQECPKEWEGIPIHYRTDHGEAYAL